MKSNWSSKKLREAKYDPEKDSPFSKNSPVPF